MRYGLLLGLTLPLALAVSAQTRQFQAQVSKIPAMAEGNVIVVYGNNAPASALSLPEGKQVSLPVIGRIGSVNLPAGTVLVGRFLRSGENLGYFQFDTLLVQNRVYPINAVSSQIPGRLQVDPSSPQNPRDNRDVESAQVRQNRQAQAGRNTAQYGSAGGSILGLVTGSWQAGTAVSALSNIVGTSQQASAVDETTSQQEKILAHDIPSILVTEVAPFQNLPVRFNEGVDLAVPLATLPVAPNP
jgi:hypothetical protein